MNMKNKGIILGFIVMVILIAIFMKKPIETKKEIRYNTTHKRKDIEKIMDMAIDEYTNAQADVYSVYYDEDISHETEQSYLQKDTDIQEVIVVYLEFKTRFFNVHPALGENHYYSDYMYIACKNADGIWQWKDGGYG